MIISHKHKFIFIKTSKTAGTSIEIALSKFCGKEDIITPISPVDESTRKNMGYTGCQNYQASISEYRVQDIINLLVHRKRKLKYYNHISALEIKQKIDPSTWDSYYKFCFERNPWDRVISSYYWKNKKEPRPTITEFLNTKKPRRLRSKGFKLYTINGEIAVNKICRYEKINEELEELRSRFNFPEPIELPRAKASFRKDRRSPAETLNQVEIEKIRALFSKEIELFGYTL